MSHAQSLLFPLCLTSSAHVTRTSNPTPSLSFSHGDDHCDDPQHVATFGPLAEPQVPTDYEPNALTEEDTATLVKPMCFHRSSMTSTNDSADHCIYRRERQVPTDHEFITPTKKTQCQVHLTCEQVQGDLQQCSHTRKLSQESRSDREGVSLARRADRGENEALSRLSESENAAILALEEQINHLLAEAKSEVLQDCRADFLVCSIREFQRQIHSNPFEIDKANGYEESRREQARLHEELA